MQTILLTGAHGELGAHVQPAIREQGWTVLAPSIEDVDLLSTEDIAEYITSLPGELDGLVHLVGGIRAGKPVHDTTEDDVTEMFRLNVVTAFNIIRAVMPLFIAHGRGSIVTVGARDVVHPAKNRSAYMTAKSAVVGLTRAVAEEGRAHNIRANVILPSILRTPSNVAWGSADDIASWVHPVSVARTIVHLLEPTCAINGATIPVFGDFPV